MKIEIVDSTEPAFVYAATTPVGTMFVYDDNLYAVVRQGGGLQSVLNLRYKSLTHFDLPARGAKEVKSLTVGV